MKLNEIFIGDEVALQRKGGTAIPGKVVRMGKIKVKFQANNGGPSWVYPERLIRVVNHSRNEELIEAANNFDWGQPQAAWAPCFHLGRDSRFCGRAPWWDGHEAGSHKFVSLADLIRNIKK